MTGMMPHSHMGKRSPRRPPMAMASTRLRGITLATNCCGTSSSRTPAITAPRTMNGIASHRMLMKIRMKFLEAASKSGTVLTTSGSNGLGSRSERLSRYYAAGRGRGSPARLSFSNTAADFARRLRPAGSLRGSGVEQGGTAAVHQIEGRGRLRLGDDQRRRDAQHLPGQRPQQVDALVAVPLVAGQDGGVGPVGGRAAGVVRHLHTPDHAALFA